MSCVLRYVVLTAAALSVVAPPESQANAIKVVDWAFNGNTNDATGLGNHGTIGTTGGSASYTVGKWGQAISLDVGSYVHNTQASNLPLAAADSWSMNIWLNLASQPESLSDLAQFGLRQPSGSYSGQSRGFLQYGGTENTGFYFWGNVADQYSGVGYYADSAWHMYTIICVGGAASQSLTMYRDGSLVKTGTVSLLDATGQPKNIAYPTLDPREVDVGGRSPWKMNEGGWAGNVDEFTIWRGALTQSDVTSLYTTNAVPEPSTAIALMAAGLVGLLAYAWRRR